MWGEPLRRCGGRWIAGALLAAALGTACVKAAESRTGDAALPYVPGLGEIMSATQMRHLKLWYAGEARSWPLAAYELDELEEGFADAARFHPRHKSSPRPLTELLPEFTEGPVAALRKAIAGRSQPEFAAAYDALTQGCNGCHGASDFSFNVVTRPVANPYSNQSFDPAPR